MLKYLKVILYFFIFNRNKANYLYAQDIKKAVIYLRSLNINSPLDLSYFSNTVCKVTELAKMESNLDLCTVYVIAMYRKWDYGHLFKPLDVAWIITKTMQKNVSHIIYEKDLFLEQFKRI